MTLNAPRDRALCFEKPLHQPRAKGGRHLVNREPVGQRNAPALTLNWRVTLLSC